MKIIFAPSAIASLQEIVEFLEEKWTAKEFSTLENDLIKFKESLELKIISFPKISKNSDIHFSLLCNKQVKIFFYFNKFDAEIILFWPNKKDPKSLNRYLKN